MKSKESIEEQVDKTLELLDHLPRVTADAFFYTRLSVRLEKKTHQGDFHWFFDTPMVRPAFFLFFVILNVVSLIHWINQNQELQTVNQTASEELIEEYSLNQSTNSYLVFNEE